MGECAFLVLPLPRPVTRPRSFHVRRCVGELRESVRSRRPWACRYRSAKPAARDPISESASSAEPRSWSARRIAAEFRPALRANLLIINYQDRNAFQLHRPRNRLSAGRLCGLRSRLHQRQAHREGRALTPTGTYLQARRRAVRRGGLRSQGQGPGHHARVVPLSACLKRSNTWGKNSGLIPWPVSLTVSVELALLLAYEL